MKKAFLLVLVALFVMISIAGCNTWKGMGTDMKNTGKNIEGN
jgi:predicted small secreted protein